MADTPPDTPRDTVRGETAERDNQVDRLETLEVREADVAEPTSQVVRRGRTFESFHYRDYTLFWSGALVSNTGTWMQTYALSIVVYSFRRSELDLGLVNFVSGIPVLFLALVGGAIADRVDRRRLIIWAQAILLVQAAALGYLYNTGHLSSETAVTSLVWVASLGLVSGVMSALTFPAWQALMPDLVPRRSLLNAVALNSAQFQSSRLIGPLLASALVVAGVSMGGIFYVNAVSFLFVIAALWAIRPHPESQGALEAASGVREAGAATRDNAEDVGAWARFTAGVRYARENRMIGVLVLSTAFMTVFAMPYMMLLPAIVDKALGGGKVEVSWVMAANGAGALVGSLAVASLRAGSQRRQRLIPVSMLAMAVLLVGFSLSRSLPLTMVLSMLCGAALLTTNSLTNTSIQLSTPPQLRGRVMALFIMAFMGIMPISSLIFGPIGEAIGPTKAVLGGAVVLGMWAVFLILRPRLLEPDTDPVAET